MTKMFPHAVARWCMRSIRGVSPNLRGQTRVAHYLSRALAIGGPVRVDAYGCRFQIDLRDHVDELIFWENYERRCIQLWRAVVVPDAVVIDVGANVGLYTLVAASAGASVVAFEPNPPTRRRLERNLALNAAGGRVSVDARALSDVEGVGTLFDDPHADTNAYNFGLASFSDANVGGAGKAKAVQSTTLDRVVLERGIQKIDWIKMDIQGAELLALRGARTALERFRPKVLMEFDPFCANNMGWTRADLDAYLDSVGYSLAPFEGQNFWRNHRRRVSAR